MEDVLRNAGRQPEIRLPRFRNSVLLLGPVGVGKTHLTTAQGPIGIRRRMSVQFWRADKFFTRLPRRPAGQLAGSRDALEHRRGPADHRRIRHQGPGRQPAEWLAMTSDTLLAQSAIDRFTQGAHTLVIEGPSWRQRDTLNRRAAIDENKETSNAN
jgi:hypothetical protein